MPGTPVDYFGAHDFSTGATKPGYYMDGQTGMWMYNPTNASPDVVAANASAEAAQAQAAALQKQIDTQNAANKAGPQLQYNPLNEDGTLKDQWKLGNADKYTGMLAEHEKQMGMQARDTAAQQGQTAIAQGKENLAMRGGAGSNNSALLEAQGMRQGLANQQSASNQSAQNLSNIGTQGAGANLKIDQANLGTQLTAAQNVNTFNLDKYNQNMAVEASKNQAEATRAAGSSGGKK